MGDHDSLPSRPRGSSILLRQSYCMNLAQPGGTVYSPMETWSRSPENQQNEPTAESMSAVRSALKTQY